MSTRRLFVAVVGLLAAALLILALPRLGARDKTRGVRVLYTANTRGYLEACG